jgi:hypothetical protein
LDAESALVGSIFTVSIISNPSALPSLDLPQIVNPQMPSNHQATVNVLGVPPQVIRFLA